MKSIAILALLGFIEAKKLRVLMESTGCPPHEPLCNDREVHGIHPEWTKSLGQLHPCPADEPLCNDREVQGIHPTWTKAQIPNKPCPADEPLCYQPTARSGWSLSQKQLHPCPEHEPLCNDREVHGIHPIFTAAQMQTQNLNELHPCPPEEPLCNDREVPNNTGIHPMWTKNLAQTSPNGIKNALLEAS